MTPLSSPRLFSLRFLAQCLLLSAATWVALTRLQDHFHHVIDITAAAVVGVITPVFILMSPLNQFREEQMGRKCGEVGPLLGK